MSKTVVAGQEGELEIKTYLISFFPRNKPHWAERSLGRNHKERDQHVLRLTGLRPEVRGGKEAMLAQLQGGWKEIMGAPENISHKASKRTVFAEISLIPSYACSGEICISFFLTAALCRLLQCFNLLNLYNHKEVKLI